MELPGDELIGFTVAALEPNRHLVLHSTEHLPPHFEDRFGAWIDWTWAFVRATEALGAPASSSAPA